MDRFVSFDGTPIAYLERGSGPAVLLLHGFAADHRINWVRPGVIDALVGAGRRVIATDARGHGASGKPHDPAAYANGAMVRDARALLDHLALESVDLAGYSMGGMVSARVAAADRRVRSLVLAGVGGDLIPPRRGGAESPLAKALLADDPATISNPTAKAFRVFAQATGADRVALAAIERSDALRSAVDFDAITMPTLVVAGAGDVLIQPPQALAERLPRARLRLVAGDHLSAVNDPVFAAAIVEFLEEHGGAVAGGDRRASA
ncbi:MAG TPA: alpha/beta fold hydrolase [Myxococcota bacterium]|jgi:pimeloyl-ACP methyl ester carboxylesterase|nr:alpha/beta fold hydrolase [Myxococcota bacterium]